MISTGVRAIHLAGALGAAAAWLAGAATVFGQGRPDGQTTAYESGVRAQYAGRTGLRGGGERSVFRGSADASQTAYWRGWRAKLDADVEWTRPDWDGVVPPALQAAETDALLDERLGVTLSRWTPTRGGWILRGDIGVAGVPDASADRAATVGVMGQYIRPFSERFSVNVGAMARTRLSDDPLVLPLAGFMWSPMPSVQFGTEGPGLILRVRAGERARVTARARWDSQDYRLADDAHPGDGVARLERIIAEAEWSRQTQGRLEWRLAAGTTTRERWEVRDPDGHRLIRVSARPAPIVAAGCRWRF